MNICYIVMAWNQPALLKRMIGRLSQPNAWFFVHIDKKNGDLATFRELFAGDEHVVVVSEYKVYWGGISQVKTALHLLGMACAAGIPFKYHVFLSGQDYPIKSNEYINEFFAAHSCDFMSYNRIAHLPGLFVKKYQYYHYLDSKYLNPKEPTRIKLLYYAFYGIINRLGRYIPKRKFYKDFTPYFGSDWMVLSDESVRYVLDFVARNKDYMRYMTYTEIPSELFIHNILLNSERRTNVSDYARYTEWLKTRREGDTFMPRYSSLRYMDWENDNQPTRPAVLDETYFDIIKNDPALFARKVDGKASAGLLDKIDRELLGG